MSEKKRTTVAISAETQEWLHENARGPHSIGKLIDEMVRDRELASMVETLVIERLGAFEGRILAKIEQVLKSVAP